MLLYILRTAHRHYVTPSPLFAKNIFNEHYPQKNAPRCISQCSAVCCPMQCGVLPDAVHCVRVYHA